jgi:hypothetical protein
MSEVGEIYHGVGGAMSDGPYRTLNMRQHWKQLLKRAYQHAFDSQDVIDAICPALERDCAWEITNDFMPALQDYCTDKNADLFDDRDARLERLKHLTAGRGTLGAVIADCAQEALLQGKTGQEAVDQALHQALTDRLARNSLQMEEHVLRESGARKASDVRGRLARAMAQAPIGSLVQKLGRGTASSNAAPPKHAGLEDGVGI